MNVWMCVYESCRIKHAYAYVRIRVWVYHVILSFLSSSGPNVL